MIRYTKMTRKEDVTRNWVHFDAEGQILGRLCVEIAKLLMGKDKVDFTPHVDGGDFVVVTNAKLIAVTGKKLTDKKYYNHSGFPGGLRERALGEILDKKPEEVILLAVKRMLPKNKLGSAQLKRLRVFAGAEHDHVAQKPENVSLGGN